MKKLTRLLMTGMLAVLLIFGMTGQVHADEPKEGNEPTEQAWNWSVVVKIAAQSDADKYKVLTIGGEETMHYVPYDANGEIVFTKEGLAEQITATLQNVVNDEAEDIPLAVTSVDVQEGESGKIASLSLAPKNPLPDSANGLYYVKAVLPGQTVANIYGYAVINPKTTTAANNIHVRVYDNNVSDRVRPKFFTADPLTVSYTARESRTPFSGDLITYPTAVDALLAAQATNTGLQAVYTRPYQNDVQRAIVVDMQINDVNYVESSAQSGLKWRFAIYNSEGKRQKQLIPGIADLYHLADGDTVVWALSSRNFPDQLPKIPDKDANVTPGELPGDSLDIKRWAGANRQEVAANVANAFFADTDRVILVNNLAFADAISATNISQGRYPILYTQADSLLSETRAALSKIQPKQVFIMGGTGSVSASVEAAVSGLLEGTKVIRIGGKDRFEVNAKAAAVNFASGVSNAVITTGMVYSDALTATPLAMVKNAPVLLVKGNELPPATKAYLQKQPSPKLTILGGTGSVSSSVQRAMESVTGTTAERFGGANRYEVAANVAKTYFDSANIAMVASGEVFSDALVAAPLSQKLSAPILLVQKNNVSASIQSYMKQTPTISLLHVLGGEGTISASVLNTFGEFGRPTNSVTNLDK